MQTQEDKKLKTSPKIKESKEIKESREERVKAPAFKGYFLGERVVSEEIIAKELYGKSHYGEPFENKIYYSPVEALYLIDRKRLEVYEGKKKLTTEAFMKKAIKLEPNFHTKFVVYRDMRNKGYIVKTALKFGADFRVYERGTKPGEDHAKWILYPVYEGQTMTWHEFAAKNRVAHSTKKRLLLGVVDDENDITYWEARWIRP